LQIFRDATARANIAAGMAVAFDTLAYARRLRQAGFSEQQAEVQAEALAAVVSETLATKQDLRELEYRLTLRLGAMLTVAVGAVAALVKLA
jgi:hypothetical protein